MRVLRNKTGGNFKIRYHHQLMIAMISGWRPSRSLYTLRTTIKGTTCGQSLDLWAPVIKLDWIVKVCVNQAASG